MGAKRSNAIRTFDPSVIAYRLAEAIRGDLSAVNQATTVDPASVRFTEKVYESTLTKKFSWDSDEETMQEDAFTAFRYRMSHMRRSNDFLVNLRHHPDLNPHLHRALNRARVLAGWILGTLDIEEWFEKCRHSAGVTQGTLYRDTSMEAKFSFPCTTTRAVIPLFSEYLQWDSNLAEALFWANLKKNRLFDIVEYSRATSVPKTQDKCRMIAIEPTLGMFFQQGLMAVMYSRLKDVGLDVTKLPDRHKEWAWRGSIHSLTATIDFSSASDCVSTELARWILPESWCSAIFTVRSASIKLNAQVMELPIVSTMGNATTFPLETLVFYCLAVASVMDSNGPYNGSYESNPLRVLSTPEERSKVSVFGDDCLLPTACAKLFMSYCTSVGFDVNEEKSFYDTQGFRESCGGDFFHGRNTRGLYITAPSTDRLSGLAPWLYGLFNRIRKKYILYFGPLTWLYDKKALSLIFQLFREHGLLIRLVPRYMPEDSGLQVVDIERLMGCYNFPIACISSSYPSGLARFTYSRFRFKTDLVTCDELRYWDELRGKLWVKPLELGRWPDPDDPFLSRKDRAKGGYYVASGETTVW